MPQYFDPRQLTEEQQSRWDWAMAEYERVQDANLDRQIAAMTPEEQARALASYRTNRPDDKRSLREWMKMGRSFFGGAAGDSKSALFARLLNGKAALPFPPPTSYSYPWYGVIEQRGSFRISIGGVPTLGGHIRGTGGAKGPIAIGINQCAWAVVDMNAAAERLLALQDQLSKTAQAEEGGWANRRFTWTSDLLAQVQSAYAEGPEFIVRHGQWAEYRLRLGRHKGVEIQRGYITDAIQQLEHNQLDMLSNNGSVFETFRLLVNAEVGAIVSKAEHPGERLERLKAAAQIETASEGDGICRVSRLALAIEADGIEQSIADYEADPSRQDTVRLAYDDWFLEKAFIKAPFTAAEVQHLNEGQTHTGPGLPAHPFTCANRSDGKHGKEAGDTGVLIATEAGWVCPHCEYTQDWAHAAMAAPQPVLAGVLGDMSENHARERLQACLPAYQALAAIGAAGATVMVECLQRRQRELDAPARAIQNDRTLGNRHV